MAYFAKIDILTLAEWLRWLECHPVPEVSNLWPAGHMRPRMAMNAAQYRIVNLLKTLRFFW